MYDAREKAIRDRQWAMNAARREGKLEGKLEGEIKGEIKLIRTLEEIIGLPQRKLEELEGMELEHLQRSTREMIPQNSFSLGFVFGAATIFRCSGSFTCLAC